MTYQNYFNALQFGGHNDMNKAGYFIQRRDCASAMAQNLLPDGCVILAGNESVGVVLTAAQAKAYAESGLLIQPYVNPMDLENESERRAHEHN